MQLICTTAKLQPSTWAIKKRRARTHKLQKVNTKHLHQRVDEHKRSVIGNHVRECHGKDVLRIEGCFTVLRKCQGKYECLLFEMLYIKGLKPSLNVQSDSIGSKLYV